MLMRVLSCLVMNVICTMCVVILMLFVFNSLLYQFYKQLAVTSDVLYDIVLESVPHLHLVL